MSRNPIVEDWLQEADESKIYPQKDPTQLTDFEKRYPVDPAGQEAGDNARVWRVYQDRMNAMDEDTISAWNDSINFLLVFAGLFSAVLTAFVIESSKALERDPSETTAELLVALVSHFNGSNIPSRSQLSLDHFDAPASARVVNALWYLSLSFALVVSMLAILAKQWITMFSSRMRSPAANFRRWAHRHRVFRDGLDRWHLNAFISSLSVAVHGSVLLFLTGLIVHLYTRDLIIFGLILGVTLIAFAFYLAATVAPLFDETCPTATPLLIHGRLFSLAILHAVRRLFRKPVRDAEAGNPPLLVDKPSFDPDAVLEAGDGYHRDVRILMLMAADLPAGHDVDVALDAIGGLELERHVLGDNAAFMRDAARRRVEQLSRTIGATSCDAGEIARALRSSIFIESCLEVTRWNDIQTLAARMKSMRAHDMFVLSRALQLRLQWHDSISIESELLFAVLESLERSQKPFEALFDATGAIARWKLRNSPASQHPVYLQNHARFSKVVMRILPEWTNVVFNDLELCALFVICFGGEIDSRRRCNEVLTLRTIAAINRRTGNLKLPVWEPLPDPIDWRLRAIDLWAHVKNIKVTHLPVDSIAGHVYAYLLAH